MTEDEDEDAMVDLVVEEGMAHAFELDENGGLDDVTLSVLASLVMRCGGAVEIPSTEFGKYYELDVRWVEDRQSFVLEATRTEGGLGPATHTEH